MVVKINIKDELEVDEIMMKFYDAIGLDEATKKEKLFKYYEYVHRIKGFNGQREVVMDYLLDETFWLGVWFAKANPDSVELTSVEEETEEEPTPEPTEEETTESSNDDWMYR